MEVVVETIGEVIGGNIPDKSGDLFGQGLDSLGVLKLITLLEERLGIEIDDNDLTIENMSTVNSIFDMVKKYEN